MENLVDDESLIEVKDIAVPVLNNRHMLPDDFDWKFYLIKNVDLILEGINTEESATKHYLDYGINEYRVYYEKCKINTFIYCGGKCGSSTLYETIRKNNFKGIKLHSNAGHMFFNGGESVFDIINHNRNHNEILYFIDSYRNPIERKISLFFNNGVFNLNDYSIDNEFEKFTTKYIKNCYMLTLHFKFEKKNDLLKLVEKFSEHFVISEDHNTYLKITFKTVESLNIFCNILDKYTEYFGVLNYKKQLLNNTEYYHPIDEVFRHYDISESFTKFDFDKKYGIYQYENMVFIKLRFCDINSWDKILSEIFGKKITLFSDNLSEHKEYSDLYKDFKSQFKISRPFIKELLKDEHFNAYNAIEEKRKYIKYWMDRSY